MNYTNIFWIIKDFITSNFLKLVTYLVTYLSKYDWFKECQVYYLENRGVIIVATNLGVTLLCVFVFITYAETVVNYLFEPDDIARTYNEIVERQRASHLRLLAEAKAQQNIKSQAAIEQEMREAEVSLLTRLNLTVSLVSILIMISVWASRD